MKVNGVNGDSVPYDLGARCLEQDYLESIGFDLSELPDSAREDLDTLVSLAMQLDLRKVLLMMALIWS